MKSLKINLDDIQMCITVHIPVIPAVERSYMLELNNLAKRGKVCLLPSVILDQYDQYIREKINAFIHLLPYDKRHTANKRR